MLPPLPHVHPTDREEYIAAQVIHAFWLAHVHRIAEHAWMARRDFTIFAPTGMEVDAAAKELTVQLEAYGLLRPPVAEATP